LVVSSPRAHVGWAENAFLKVEQVAQTIFDDAAISVVQAGEREQAVIYRRLAARVGLAHFVGPQVAAAHNVFVFVMKACHGFSYFALPGTAGAVMSA
jgi:hypothetical protein